MIYAVEYQSRKTPDQWYEIWFRDFRNKTDFLVECQRLGRKTRSYVIFAEGKAA